MSGVYIFVGICVFVIIIFTIWIVNLVIVPQIKMQKSSIGERTKFIIDTTNKDYEYYENFVSEWLELNKFSSYSKKRNGRILKYYASDLIFRFGFNHYRKNQNMIIETWLSVFGKENPLTTDTNQQGKDEYLLFLNSLINIPKTIKYSNNVTLKDNYDLNKIKNQESEKKKNHKTVFIILTVSFLLTAVLYLLRLI